MISNHVLVAPVVSKRRVAVGLGMAVAAAAVVALARPAAAHFCAFPVTVDAGEEATITVGVAAEETFLVDVAIRIPEGFRVERVGSAPNWTSEHDGATVRLTGGGIAPFTCEYFSLVGVAEREGTFVFPLTATDDMGKVFEYTSRRFGDDYAAQIVETREPRTATRGTGDDGPALSPVVVVTLAAAALVVALIAVRHRRVARRRASDRSTV